ncbi:hypothetical protein ACWEVD_00365 [Nocardia thailandica]
MRAHVERARARMDQRRAEQKIRDRHISAAVKRFAAASAAETACEEARDQRVAALQQTIQQAREAADDEIAGMRLRQRAALMEMKEQGQTEDEITDLLGLPLRKIRQLLALAPPETTVLTANSGQPVVLRSPEQCPES